MASQNQKLDPEEIARLAYRAGFRGADVETITAIAMTESAGPGAGYGLTHPKDNLNNNGSVDRGLLQINSIHTDFTGNPYDPAEAMTYAYQLYKRAGNRFTDWTTYTGGTYKTNLRAAQRANLVVGQEDSSQLGQLGQAGTTLGNLPADVAGQVPGVSQLKEGINAVGDFLNNLRQPATLERFGAGTIALLLIGVGVVVVAWPLVRSGMQEAAKGAEAA